jgi:hypothetical protein
MEINNRIGDLFQVIDKKDIKAFSSFLDDNIIFRFGNMPVVNGKRSVTESVQGFYDSIRSLSHQVDNIWNDNNTVVCNGTVTYTRHDSGRLTVPFANIYKIGGDNLIKEYLIYADISGLYK